MVFFFLRIRIQQNAIAASVRKGVGLLREDGGLSDNNLPPFQAAPYNRQRSDKCLE